MAKEKKSKAPPVPVQPEIYCSLHSLLETIRVIKVYEDPLCTLLHAIRTAGSATQEVKQELDSLLDEMPSEAYGLELESLRTMLANGTSAANSGGTTAKAKVADRAPEPAKMLTKRSARAASSSQRP